MRKITLLAALCGWILCGLASLALADDGVNPNTVTNEKLKTIRIPEVKFKETPLSQVIEYLEKQSFENDPGPVVTGVKFIYMPPKGVDPHVKLTLRNAKLGTVLDLVCQKTGYEWDFREGMIVVKPNDNPQSKASNAPMKTQVFELNRAIVDRATYQR